MAKTPTRTNLLTSQSLAGGAASVRSAVIDNTSGDGGFITARLTNGATGPTVQCTIKLLFAHNQASAPTAAAEGTGETDWKVIAEVGNGTLANNVCRFPYSIGPEKAGFFHLEFGGNTGQAVTIEAQATMIVYS